MSDPPSGPVQFTVLIVLVVGILGLPLLFVRLLPVAASLLPGWVIRTVCIGFFCAVTITFLGFLLVVPVFWVTAALYDRGYLPDAW